jgi:hypothetical protein
VKLSAALDSYKAGGYDGIGICLRPNEQRPDDLIAVDAASGSLGMSPITPAEYQRRMAAWRESGGTPRAAAIRRSHAKPASSPATTSRIAALRHQADALLWWRT